MGLDYLPTATIAVLSERRGEMGMFGPLALSFFVILLLLGVLKCVYVVLP